MDKQFSQLTTGARTALQCAIDVKCLCQKYCLKNHDTGPSIIRVQAISVKELTTIRKYYEDSPLLYDFKNSTSRYSLYLSSLLP